VKFIDFLIVFTQQFGFVEQLLVLSSESEDTAFIISDLGGHFKFISAYHRFELIHFLPVSLRLLSSSPQRLSQLFKLVFVQLAFSLQL
jgi:hypothetical protein